MPNTTPNMGLKSPIDATDTYDEQAYDVFNNGQIDAHSHTGAPNNGVQLGTAALVANAVTQNSFVTSGTNFSTGSTALVDVTGMVATLITSGGPCLVFFSGPATATAQSGSLALNLDGTDSAILASIAAGGPANTPVALCFLYAPAAGSHTFKLRAQTAAGGGTIAMNFGAANGVFMVIELKR